MKEKERLMEMLFKKIEVLSEEQLKALDIFMDFLQKEENLKSGNLTEDSLIKKLDERRKNDRTKFL
ncbi:hypothetical protein MYP_3426 [Sporocytophaga myxococcoides]|uniref:DUF2281 domain-containing protein n=1 Tax=Sporocytophaga myxococcoides TaxID=153721 RepID=A0A098LI99_9BACT|nr:hypothetical protein [Sporocytophaga myxococcoides]GAL86197.1 hypothetical protein MYP_3426 [Sporocytophaga myxococcoides]